MVNDTSFLVKCFCILDLSPLASKTTHHFPSPRNQQPSRPTRTMGHKQEKRNLQPHLKTCSFLFYRSGLGPEDMEFQQMPKGLVLLLVSGPHFEKQRLRCWFSSSGHAGAHQWNLSPWGKTRHWVEPGFYSKPISREDPQKTSAQAPTLHLTTCPVAEARRQKILSLNVWIMANSHSQGGEHINHSKSIHLMNICGCCCSVTQSCPTLRNPTDCSMPGFLVIHYLLDFVQTHVMSVIPSNHLILGCPLHLLPSIIPSIIPNICSMPTNPKKTLLGIWDTWQSETDVVFTLIKLTLVGKDITWIIMPILAILSHHRH